MVSKMLPKKVNFRLLVFLIGYCVIFLFLFVMLLVFGMSVYAYFNVGGLNYGWGDVIYSGKTALAGGIPLGIGCWILSKLDERKRNAPHPPEE